MNLHAKSRNVRIRSVHGAIGQNANSRVFQILEKDPLNQEVEFVMIVLAMTMVNISTLPASQNSFSDKCYRVFIDFT